jgi:hypothetical protein
MKKSENKNIAASGKHGSLLVNSSHLNGSNHSSRHIGTVEPDVRLSVLEVKEGYYTSRSVSVVLMTISVCDEDGQKHSTR